MKNPVTHWWHQRITAGMMVILLPWFTSSFILQDSTQWECYFSNPIHITGLFLLLITAVYHMVLGLNIVIEDYVHDKKWLSFLTYFIHIQATILIIFGSACLIRLVFIGSILS